MKKIECYIQPYDLNTVADALAVEGVVGMSVYDLMGFGVQRGFRSGQASQPGQYVFHPKMKVEMVVAEQDIERIIEAIQHALKTKRIGDGKIFVSPVDDAVRTRTGERGQAAIQ